jgi:DNA-binding response OmpR family regulator
MARIPQTCCLLAEDQALIGMALEAMLEEAGIPVIGPFACAAEALTFAQQVTPCIAILDYKLKDGPCTELATALMAQGVPVIIYSGWPHDRETPPELAGATWMEKPAAPADLLQAIAALAPALSSRLLGAAA